MTSKNDPLKKIVNKFYVPDTVAKNFTDNADFVLDNTHIISGKPIWKFSWHPFDGELLIAIEPISHKIMVQDGQYRFEEYLWGIYLAESRIVLFRPYYNSFISQDYDEELSHKIMEACQSALGGEELVKYIWDIDNRHLIERFGNRGW